MSGGIELSPLLYAIDLHPLKINAETQRRREKSSKTTQLAQRLSLQVKNVQFFESPLRDFVSKKSVSGKSR